MSNNEITINGVNIEPLQAIFPILKEIGEGKNQMIGTGFFITKIGHFVTAKHVIEDIYNIQERMQSNPIHAIHFVEGFSVLVRNITAIIVHNNSDLAIG